jgi:hypothetical protein
MSRNDLDGAANSLVPVLALPPEQRIRDLINGMQLVHEKLDRFDAPDARDLQEQIRTFVRASLPRMLE